MMNNRLGGQPEDRSVITVLLVDDIPETRENIRKLLAFEEDEFQVIGSVGTGREALQMAHELHPDIVIMDINMPDMDGLQATNEITKTLPGTGVIMMSVQTDQNYLKKAMQAGARSFLYKPVDPDELYSTIRMVYKQMEAARRSQRIVDVPIESSRKLTSLQTTDGSVRAGHVIVVYSPSGGAGCTTIATNLASGLMKKNIKVLLVDADLQFGDVGVFLKLSSQTTLVDVVAKVDDLDTDFFDTIAATHESGLRVLLGPQRPEFAADITDPSAIARVIEKVAVGYDFIVVDTSRHFDEALISLMDMATKIVLVATPTLAHVKNTRFVLDLFEKLGYPPEKITFVLNRVEDEKARNRVTVPTDTIERYLKRKVDAKLPNNEAVVLSAVNKGVPAIALARDRSKAQSPVREMIDFSEKLFSELMDGSTETAPAEDANKKKSGLSLRIGRG